ncbi:19160_t:CDS:2 [Entrophospora sp. SA101]|nr:21782_t:CDS:2 [Entrophospora sp. SA101]CAJ0754041.1 17408_t:CDS:2 [Entrophospora sp. SA101]CAJ0758124.1 19160_t:CDS:2 [Entrophospora sp. SA101]
MSGTVIFKTSMGTITFELYWDHSPKTCKNFYDLTKRGYYNGVIVEIIPDFMIQGGDPTGTGRGAPTPWLDGKHTIFGRVSDGMRVVKRMGLVPTDSDDRPKDDVKILSAHVI